jgi:hypothetical protein
MTQNDEKKFAIFMAMLGTAFERGELSTAKIEMYFEFLSDLHIDAVERGVKGIIATRKFPSFPTIAEIREAALGGDAQSEGAALIAWGEAVRLISAGQRSQDERINEAIVLAFGSWQRFGQTNPEMEASDRKHFIACFKSIEHRRREALALNGGVEAKQLTEGGARRLREAREGGGA